MPLVFAAVAHGEALLAEYARVGGNFSSVAADQLAHAGHRARAPSGGGGGDAAGSAAVVDGFVYVTLADASGYTFVAVADEASGRAAADAFLAQLRGDFVAQREGGSGGGGEIEAADSIASGDAVDYSTRIGELLAAAEGGPGPRGPPSPGSLQRRVDAVKAAAGSNVELVALGAADDAGGGMGWADDRAAAVARKQLEAEAGRFSGAVRGLRERMRQSRCRLRASLIVMVSALVFIAVMLACFGINVPYCSPARGGAKAPAPAPVPVQPPGSAGAAPPSPPQEGAAAAAAPGSDAGQAPPQQAGRRLRRLQGKPRTARGELGVGF